MKQRNLEEALEYFLHDLRLREEVAQLPGADIDRKRGSDRTVASGRCRIGSPDSIR